jgi:eukaryotic-like serine/threonine-protein kinase
VGAVARLQLARALVLSGNAGEAKAAYEDFRVLWKHADPEIPILKQAKAEYARLP